MELLEQIKEAGVIGAGGAGFPTHAKVASKAQYILMNAAECEPLLRVDQQLMYLYAEEILKGFVLAGQLVGAEKAIIGIKGKHSEVIAHLLQKIKELDVSQYVSIKELKDVYPVGDEQLLVYELTGRVVPETGIPIHVGCVVMNSETAYNVYQASIGKAVTEKFVTLAGDIPKHLTVKVPIGTPIIDVLKLSGIENFDSYAVIDGGPMMGPVLQNLNGFITKKNKGFVILKKQHPLIRKKSVTLEQAKRVNRSSCEQCRMCTDLCPRYLLGHHMQPHKVMRGMNYALEDIQGQKIAQLCSQCGLCELFSCPAGLYPKSANLYFRQKLAEQNMKYQPNQESYEARQMREYRLVPSKRLIARLRLKEYDQAAPMSDYSMMPSQVQISTLQHVGAAAIPVVSPGDKVTEGQLIGQIPDGKLGATIHTSITGTVAEVTAEYVVIRRD